MSDLEQTDKQDAALDHMIEKKIPPFAEVMPRVASEYGRSLSGQVRDLASYCLGKHKLSIDEYYDLKLFDPALTDAQRHEFVGLRKMNKIYRQFYPYNNWRGILDNKLCYELLMSSFGFATATTRAVVGDRYPAGGPTRIMDADDLHAFLKKAAFPLFGKPTNSSLSKGSARLEGYDARKRMIRLSRGNEISVEQLVHEIKAYFGGEYLIQDCVEMHPELEKISGKSVSTVRIVTIASPDGPKVWRALIKWTGKGNVADNFWRDGNLVSAIDVKTGEISAALTKPGIAGERLDNHPETGGKIAGQKIPFWDEACSISCEGMKLMARTAIIGYDIAITPTGPLIIETNTRPDMLLPQHATGRGSYDDEMKAMEAYYMALVSEQNRKTRELRRKHEERKTEAFKQALEIPGRKAA